MDEWENQTMSRDLTDVTASGGTDSTQLKELILKNSEYLENELDILLVIDHFLREKKITVEQEKYILKAEGRRARVKRFLLLILAEFDTSTYNVLKASIPERNEYILNHLDKDERSIVAIEQDESLREDATKRVIRLMWIPLMDTVGHNVTVLAGHLCQERRITPREETYIVTSKRNPRDKAVELLQTVERKGWQCLVELVNGMKLLVPLHDLTRRMLTAMEQCERSDECPERSDESSENIEMEPWQKILLLTSYPDLRERLDPLTLVDDMVVLGIIQPEHIETLQRHNRLERNGWFLWHVVLHVGTEQCYNSFMTVLQQNEPRIFQVLKDKEESLRDDPRTQSLKMMNLERAFTDGELKCHCIRTSSGEIISTMSAETTDRVLSRITIFLEPYGDVIQAVEGSLIIHIRFHNLVKLTTFWLAYLDDSLANQMLNVFMTDEIAASHDPSSLHLDLEFNLNNYVDAAYQLSMHPAAPTTTAIRDHGQTHIHDDQPVVVHHKEMKQTENIIEENKREVKELKEKQHSQVKELKETHQSELNYYQKIIDEKEEEIKSLKSRSHAEIKYYKKILDEKEKGINQPICKTIYQDEVMSGDLVVRQSLEMEKKKDIRGLVVLRGHLVVTQCEDSSLYVYQAGRSPVHKHQVRGLRRPCHILGVKDGKKDHVVIADTYNKLHWVLVLVEGAELKLGAVRTIKLDYKPWGMCVTSISQLVVCSPDTDRLYKYSSDGQCLCHIQLASELRPVCITSLSAGDGYVISDYRQIRWIRKDGTPSRRVRGEVRPGIELGIPLDLIRDNDGQILVADAARHQVLVFDQRGRSTGQLLSDQDGILLPTRLLLDKQTDTLYVSCNAPVRVMIYRYSPLLATLTTTSSETSTQSKLDETTQAT